MKLDQTQFDAFAAQGYNYVPIVVERYADLDTPLSLYLKLVGEPSPASAGSFLLESVIGGERFGRYSYVGLPARTWLSSYPAEAGAITEVKRDGAVIERHQGNPLEFIAEYQARFRTPPMKGLPRFCGGFAGYFGYDAVRYIEPKLESMGRQKSLNMPDILLLQCEELAVIDRVANRIKLIVYASTTEPGALQRAHQRLEEMLEKLRQPVVVSPVVPSSEQPIQRHLDKENYIAAVRRTKEYIAAGDIMQAQIGQRLTKAYAASPLSLYRAVRAINPSPYMYYYDLGEFHIAGASPEVVVRQEAAPEGQRVTIRPLAGTRPRGETVERDQELERELLADPKERAEHLMLIDLARNDLGRISKAGSVKVTEAFVVERYSHVMHIISNVEGCLREGLGNLDVLRATFPTGTLTGAPKIRAMEIIDELEPVNRGFYGGAVGYMSFSGDMDLAIAIRTGIVKDQTLYVQASAGIVADSVPENEWLETEAKARAILHAAEMVENGLS